MVIRTGPENRNLKRPYRYHDTETRAYEVGKWNKD